VDYNGQYKSLNSFIWVVIWHKGLELGQCQTITNLKKVAKYIYYKLPRQILKRTICLCLGQVNAKLRLELHVFWRIECNVNLCLEA
jgi:hypothetical protein